jgi:hypothetical protein
VTLIPTYHPDDVLRGVPQPRHRLGRDIATAGAVLDGRLRHRCTHSWQELRARTVRND